MPIICVYVYTICIHTYMSTLNYLFLDFNSAVELGQTTCNYMTVILFIFLTRIEP